MFKILLLFLLIFTVANGLFSAALVYHVRKYSLPNWRAVKIVVPVYFGLLTVFLALALYSLAQI